MWGKVVEDIFTSLCINKCEWLEDIELLEEIEENVGTCCAITMDPDDVLVMIDKLKEYIENV